MTLQNLQRTIGMRDTKTNVEALTGTLEEQALAYATDTGELGIYTNGAWVWLTSATNASDLATRFEPLTDGDTTSPALIFADGDVIMAEVPN